MNTCPACGANLVKEYDDKILLSMPPVYHFRWWCGCGYRGEWETDQTLPNTLEQQWKMANRNDVVLRNIQDTVEKMRQEQVNALDHIIKRNWESEDHLRTGYESRIDILNRISHYIENQLKGGR